jgi:hypothetical protein
MPKKLILDIDDATWKNVLKFKIDNDLKNNNEAVVTLIKRGLTNGNPKPPKSNP